jgi:hypothetical protein
MDPSKKNEFDPFGERLSRDIRNTLSHAMIQALQQGDRDVFTNRCRDWLRQNLPDTHRTYIENRRRAFERLFEASCSGQKTELLGLAAALWNAGLFFEVHEVVENVWLTATGSRRQALKGLVQAAGSYVHHEAGRTAVAARLGRKAAANLRSSAGALGEISNIEELIRDLEKGGPEAPRLALSGGCDR